MMPELNESQFRVIEHGLDQSPVGVWEAPQKGPLRILVLGRLSQEKGAELLAALLPDLLAFSELRLLGCGEHPDARFKQSGVEMIAHYRNDRLPDLLQGHAPHLALLLSTVPETFSYTLSELWHARIPVVATATGALADRIKHGVDGFLVAPDATAVLELLKSLNADRQVLQGVKQRLSARRTRTVPAMVGDYDQLLPRTVLGFPAATPAGAEMRRAMDASARESHRVGSTGSRFVHVNPQVTWLQACSGFWHYTCGKAARSPRLPHWIRRWFARRELG